MNILRPMLDLHRAFCCAALLLGLSIMPAASQELPREDAEREIERYRDVLEHGQSDTWQKESGEDVNGRAYWFEFQRRFPYNAIPAGARATAINSMESVQSRMREAAAKAGTKLFAASQWSGIGPVNLGGRVRAIAAHPSDPSVLYIGGAAGGVWKTTDGGTTWRTTFDKQTAITIGAIAVDPINPNNIYVGTGELIGGSDIGFLADGVFKSTDAGETWRNIGLNTIAATSKIHVRADSPNVVYLTAARITGSLRYSGGAGAGSSSGFYRSTDAGETWTQTFQGQAVELSVDPKDNDKLLISTTNTVQRSTDGGRTFVGSSTGLENLNASQRMSLAHDPQNPANVFLLQAYWASDGSAHVASFYGSTDGGTSWAMVRRLDSSMFRKQGNYNNCLAVDPNDPNTILAGGVDLWRTIDGGNSWTNITRTFGSTRDRQKAHPDQHILVFDPSAAGAVYLGSDGGCYLSLSSGADFQLMHDQLPITQFYTVEIDQTRPFRVYGGTQDNQTHGGFGTNEHDLAWTRLLGGDGMWVVVDKVDPDIIYAEQPFGELYRIDTRTFTNTYIVAALTQDGGAWSSPAAMSAVDGNLYAARTSLYRTSTPRGTVRWDKLEPGFTNTSSNAVVLSLSHFDSTAVIVGNEAGDIRFTVDDGVSWTKSTGLPSRYPTDLAHDPVDRRRVYATMSGFRAGHVFISDDDGATFRNITSNLPDIPVNAIEIDPTDNRRLFVGTDIGVYVSLDGGAAWFPFNENMPVVPVTDMKIHRTRRMLVAATHGRSMFEAGIDNITMPALLLAPSGGETFATPGVITVRWAGFNGPVDVQISYHVGEPFNLIAAGVSGDNAVVPFPASRSTTARIRVVSADGTQSATSGYIALNATANIETLGKRGLTSQAIALRRGQIWATRREDDTIRRLNTPLLTGNQFVVRSGFSGTIRDLAYDEAADIFYALVAADDFSSARLYTMDTTGARVAEVPLPASITSASGIALVQSGIAVATPGVNGKITIIDKASGAVVATHAYRNIRGDYRRGLVWTGMTFTQGVVRTDSERDFPSEMHQLAIDDTARTYEIIPVITATGKPLYFFDLAGENIINGDSVYYATDTAGVFYRFRGRLFSGVETDDAVSRTASVRIASVTPNPFRTDATIAFSLEKSGDVTIELMTVAGSMVGQIFDGRLDAGAHSKHFTASTLASGLYYIVVSTGDGERVVSPVVLMR